LSGRSHDAFPCSFKKSSALIVTRKWRLASHVQRALPGTHWGAFVIGVASCRNAAIGVADARLLRVANDHEPISSHRPQLSLADICLSAREMVHNLKKSALTSA
jgi:hypothetical protein